MSTPNGFARKPAKRFVAKENRVKEMIVCTFTYCSTWKEKRDAHFKQGKTGPAPGDENEDGKPVKTKKSVHTKKFEKMFGKN